MPAGMRTSNCSEIDFAPRPAQSSHGSLMSCPVPLHSGQVITVVMVPRSVSRRCRTCPCPAQNEQGTGLLPGAAPLPSQVSHRPTRS